MYSSPVRFSRMRHLGSAMTVVGLLGGIALVGVGILRWQEVSGLWHVAAGGTLVLMSVLSAVLLRLALKIESNTSRTYSETRELHEVLSRHNEFLEKIVENTSISDSAKSIAHRNQERLALRAAIYEEIRREDYEGVFHLIDDLEKRLGYREEAERLRDENRQACNEAFKSNLKLAIEHVGRLLGERRWSQAKQEIERLEKVMPAEPRITELWNLLGQKREETKQLLLRQWNTASAESNVEQALGVLKELDEYLTRDEARALMDSAREVFKERLQQLGVQFQFAVNERRWRDALACGLEIMEEFPNSRMAAEVRERLGALRARAGITTDVEVTARDDSLADSARPAAG